MKLVVEIGDFESEGRLEHYSISHIEPKNNREGIPTLNKSKRIAELSRLIDLSKAIENAVESFYQKRTISSPSAAINTSGEPGTK